MLADNVSGRIRSDFFASISSKDMSFFDRVQVGEICKSQLLYNLLIVGRQNSDTQVINDAMNNSFNTVVKALVYTLIVLAYLLYLSPRLLGVLIGGIFTLVFVVGALRRTTAKLNK